MISETETSAELELCRRYLALCEGEVLVSSMEPEFWKSCTLLVVQGFEERSVGLLEALVGERIKVRRIVIAKYSAVDIENLRFEDRFISAGFAASELPPTEVVTNNDGEWITPFLVDSPTTRIVVDITGVSNRAMFYVLDKLASCDMEVHLAYTEAGEYWPTMSAWNAVKESLEPGGSFSEKVDDLPWLFGHQHRHELVLNHEGHDSAGSQRAIVAFLAYKAARLAALIGIEEYSEFLFIAGVPRLDENRWRLNALKEINTDLIQDHQVVEMLTFDYRNALQQLAGVLFDNPGLMRKYDVHLAILGSKLQSVACWALSSLIPSLTVVTSAPTKYYPDAFSQGIGNTWIFRLVSPSTAKYRYPHHGE